MNVERDDRPRLERQAAINWARSVMSDPGTLYLDTETTGLGLDAEIIEVALLDSQGEPLLDTLVQPRFWIPVEATRVHQITNQMVLDAPAWPEIAAELIQHLEQGRRVVAYNAAFDQRLVEQTDHRDSLFNTMPSDLIWECAMEQYARYAGAWNVERQAWRWQSLAVATADLDVPEQGRHRARADAELCRAVVVAMAEG